MVWAGVGWIGLVAKMNFERVYCIGGVGVGGEGYVMSGTCLRVRGWVFGRVGSRRFATRSEEKTVSSLSLQALC